jgi:hypothetical protein
MVAEVVVICATIVCMFGLYLWDKSRQVKPIEMKDFTADIADIKAEIKKLEVRVTKDNVNRMFR